MAIDDPNELEKVDRDIRINELKQAIGAEDMYISEECPPDLAESFLQQVVEYENALWTSNFDQLVAAGVELPPPEVMNAQQLKAKLWEVIEQLAEMRVFIVRTDHLSDRELYTHLWHDSLREAMKVMPPELMGTYHIDMLGACSEEDIYLSFKYYADEDERRGWLEQFPDYVMPEHEEPPYDRDRYLPPFNAGEDSGTDEEEG